MPAEAAAGARGRRTAAASVVQVVQSLDKGGLETMAANLAIALARRGLRSAVVSLEVGGVLEARLRDAGVDVHVLERGRWRSPSTHRRLWAILRDAAATVVHTHHLPSLLSAAPAALAARVDRVVHTEHAFQYLEHAAALRGSLRLVSRAADRVVLVGESMRDYYASVVRVDAARIRVIVNGTDVEKNRPLTDVAAARRALGLPDGFLVGTAGRFATVKNYPLLLRAAAVARATHPDLQLVMLGDGDDRADLERLAATLGISDAVHFLGWRSDVAAVLATLDLFALTSLSEGLPLVVLEAMACGLPVVASAVGDLPTVITAGETGFTFPSGDHEALAAIMARLAGSPDERRAMGARARDAVVARYSQRAMVDAYVDAYGITQ